MTERLGRIVRSPFVLPAGLARSVASEAGRAYTLLHALTAWRYARAERQPLVFAVGITEWRIPASEST